MGVVRATSACDKLCLLYDLLLFLMVSIYLKKKIIIKYTDLILGRIKLMLGMVGTGRFGHNTSSATLYKDVSAMVLFMLFYVLFITILCINNHIEYKKKYKIEKNDIF
jgi:hypothetical protein